MNLKELFIQQADKSFQTEEILSLFDLDYVKEIGDILEEEYKNYTVYPDKEDIFKAFSYPIDNIKVIITGQDPYYNGSAHGIAFSSKVNEIPASLRVIFNELERTYNRERCFEDNRPISNLEDWLSQGVFLINTILTVRRTTPIKSSPLSHSGLGWQYLVGQIINIIIERNKPIIVQWGAKARDFYKDFVDDSLLSLCTKLTAIHPAADVHQTMYKKKDTFLGCNHFFLINEILKKEGKETINWVGDKVRYTYYKYIYHI